MQATLRLESCPTQNVCWGEWGVWGGGVREQMGDWQACLSCPLPACASPVPVPPSLYPHHTSPESPPDGQQRQLCSLVWVINLPKLKGSLPT